MSRSIYNSTYRLGLYTFLYSLRSNFSPSHPLQLCFEAACESSLAQKIRRGRHSFICLFVCLSVCLSVLSSWMIGVRDKISHVLTERAWVRGVGIDLTLQSCCSWCYVITTCASCVAWNVVGCPIPSSMYEHVPINHHGVDIDFLLESCCC